MKSASFRESYIRHLLFVFDEVWRVLRTMAACGSDGITGTCWTGKPSRVPVSVSITSVALYTEDECSYRKIVYGLATPPSWEPLLANHDPC